MTPLVPPPRRPSRLALAVLAALVVVGAVLAVGGVAAAPEEPPMDAWREVDRLVDEQKLDAAVERVDALLAAAREAGDAEEWTRALVRGTQLRLALHGFAEAWRHLDATPWPPGEGDRLVLRLFAAHTLLAYLDAYRWEVEQRERVALADAESAGDAFDLDTATAEEIVAHANRLLHEVWEERERWGERSLGDLSAYVTGGDYPARIRGTLRDVVTYHWIELLADSGRWSPEHHNETERLDLETLLVGGAAELAPTSPADPELHPLRRLAALAADLESWHAGAGRSEAALEAWLERLRRLSQHFTDEDDLALLRRRLAERLGATDRELPWWAVGRVELAELHRRSADLPGGAPDALVEAREIALDAARAHPGSIGGQRARHLVAVLEAPHLTLAAMESDGPGRRSFRVEHKNLPAVWFRAYRLDLDATLAGARDWNLLPAHREIERVVASERPVALWRVDLPPTPDLRAHRTYVTPPLEERGLYVIAASARSDFAAEGNLRLGVPFLVTDLVLLSQALPGAIEVTVHEGASGDAVAGAAVELWAFDYRGGHRRVATETSGADGRARFRPPAEDRGRAYFPLARKGGDVALDVAHLQRLGRGPRTLSPASLVYTDRAVYRPGQELLWKVVAYRAEKGSDTTYRVLAGERVEVALRDANDEVVAEATATTNDFGSAAGAFTVPAGRLLGGWRVSTSLHGSAPVRVEEYERPTFEVELVDPEEPPRLGREVVFRGEVRYYFGLPVTDGEVDWRIVREPVFPWWWSWWRPRPSSTETVAAGTTALDADGAFRVAFTPAAAPGDDPGVTYRFRLSADVTAEGGETRSASRAFRLGAVAVEARLPEEVGFHLAGEPVAIAVLRTDLDGVPRAGEGRWELVRLVQPEETPLPSEQPVPPGEGPPGSPVDPAAEDADAGYRTEGDRLRPRWAQPLPLDAAIAAWPAGRTAASGTVEHGDDGVGTIVARGVEAGVYRLRYATDDPWGATFELEHPVVVAADGMRLALPVVLLVERSRVAPGETLRVLVGSGLADQELVLDLAYGAAERERRVLPGDGVRVLELPMETAHQGGVAVAVAGVRDYQLLRAEGRLLVPWTDRELEVELATFRDTLRPGQEETWTVTVRGTDGEAVAAGAAELLAYMYDRSLDLFAAQVPVDPLALLPTYAWLPPVAASVGETHPTWWSQEGFAEVPPYPHLEPPRLELLSGYGIGGPGVRLMARMEGVQEKLAMAESAPSAPAPPPSPPGLQALGTVGDASADVAQAVTVTSEAPPVEETVRTDFAETAFFFPHLVTGDDGAVSFTFTVPEAVTEWKLWVHALTRDLRAGSTEGRVRTVKDLLVRPYLPRFFREGDRVELAVVVNNASEEPLTGTLDLDVLDAETEESVRGEFALATEDATGVPFTVEPGGGVELTFPVVVPPRVGTVAVRVVARAGSLSDGELRALPVLPGRMHLAQSRFAALREGASRVLSFPDLAAAGEDPTLVQEGLIVTVDAQLFGTVLRALPYLVDFPYECTEQTLERFFAAGLLDALYERHPAVASMARELAGRETPLERWDADDPNRRMALVETPWLVLARGGDAGDRRLADLLRPEVARAEREAALGSLLRAQTAIGAFPWFPGGPPSPYMTLYILYGLAKAQELGVEVPREPVVRGWGYLHRYYVDDVVERMVEEDCCWELVTFMAYVLSAYVDEDEAWTGGVFTADDRRRMLGHSFRHWREHSPLLKAYLAMALHRAGRPEDARLVFDALMDSAKTDPDLGTYWAREERSWLWYNDTTEGHALALRAMAELDPEDPRREGLVQWLMLDKQLNHWKSTKATAEVLYALVHYLEGEGAIAARETIRVAAGPREETFVFEPDRYVGTNQLVVPGEEVTPAMAEVAVDKTGPGLAFASATWHFSTEELPAEARGDLFSVERRYFLRQMEGEEPVLRPLESGVRLRPGDQLEVHLTIAAQHAAEYVHLRDPRPAGFEPEDVVSGYRWDTGLAYYQETRDSGTNFFFDWLPTGSYTLKYRLRAANGGVFKAAPAELQSMYAPEFVGYSAGGVVEVESRDAP